jgi:hypothetical protein
VDLINVGFVIPHEMTFINVPVGIPAHNGASTHSFSL